MRLQSFVGLFLLATITEAGLVRRDARRYGVRSAQFLNTTQSHTTSTLASPTLLTIIPVESTSTGSSSTIPTAPTSIQPTIASSISPKPFLGSDGSTVPLSSVLSTSSTEIPNVATSVASSEAISTHSTKPASSAASLVGANSTTIQTGHQVGAGTTTTGPIHTSEPTSIQTGIGSTFPSDTLTKSPKPTSSVPRFTLNNTDSIIPPTTRISSLSSMQASAGFQDPTSTTDSKSSVPTIQTSSPKSSSPSETISQIPTIISSVPSATSSVSAAEFSSNLQDATAYNNLFSTLNFSSPCTGNQIACIAGNVGTCDGKGNFVITSVCTKGEECFAMPMNNTRGVFVGCTDKAAAESVLGNGASSTLGGSTIASSTAIATSAPQSTASPSSVVESTIAPSSAPVPETKTTETKPTFASQTTFPLIPSSTAPSPPSGDRTTTILIPAPTLSTSSTSAPLPSPEKSTQSPKPNPTTAPDLTTTLPLSTIFITTSQHSITTVFVTKSRTKSSDPPSTTSTTSTTASTSIPGILSIIPVESSSTGVEVGTTITAAPVPKGTDGDGRGEKTVTVTETVSFTVRG